MKKWTGTFLVLLVTIGLHSTAWANSELHPGGRLFFPLWDVSTSNRLTMIVLTRQALRDGQTISHTPPNGPFVVKGAGKCLPRGAGGSTTNVNRTDLGGTVSNPVFVDDVHLEYYGRSCASFDEIVHMSCADTDLFVLASPDNETIKPRLAFNGVAGEGRGALDVHFVTNGQFNPRFRKLENSLMGSAIITDLAEGWAASYAAAAANAVACTDCDNIDGGTVVGYENYPMELYLPFALADGFFTQGGALRNLLSLWGPGLFPGANLNATSINLEFKWWDGRERAFVGSIFTHALIRPLGGGAIDDVSALDPARFVVGNFVCGHDATGTKAENDGFPRFETEPGFCGAPDVPDTAHPSDNFESTGDNNVVGHRIQSSTPMGWWRFRLIPDGHPPAVLTGPNHIHSGRGLVGVVLSSAPGLEANSGQGVGFATRLWHEDSCEIAQSGQTIGPPHAGHGNIPGNTIALFNTNSFFSQSVRCGLINFFSFPGLLGNFGPSD